MDTVRITRGSLLYVKNKNDEFPVSKYLIEIVPEKIGDEVFYTLYFNDKSCYDVLSIGKFIYFNKEDYKDNLYCSEVLSYNNQYLTLKIKHNKCIYLFNYLNKKYNFDGPLHSTNVNNLIRIIKYKAIWNRNLLDCYGAIYDENANKSVISNTELDVLDFVRFYYYYKTPTNYCSRDKTAAILVLDCEKVSNIPLENIRIYDGNAAHHESRYTQIIDEALEYDWDTIFERGPYDSSNKEITRKRNAEFMILNTVPLDLIKYIIFKNENDLLYVEKYCDDELRKKLILDRSKFD